MKKSQSFTSITSVILFVVFRFAPVNLLSQEVYPFVNIQISVRENGYSCDES